MKKTRLEISFEQREIWRVSRFTQTDADEEFLCPFCFEQAAMIYAEELAACFATSPREIYRRIESGTLHFVETKRKTILVCPASFSQKEKIINEK